MNGINSRLVTIEERFSKLGVRPVNNIQNIAWCDADWKNTRVGKRQRTEKLGVTLGEDERQHAKEILEVI